jgi:hypothetical protein
MDNSKNLESECKAVTDTKKRTSYNATNLNKMYKILFAFFLSFLFSCGSHKTTVVNHCKKGRHEAYRSQMKMERARRRASRWTK